LLLSNVK